MDARSALFDLYGDHLRARGGRAPVAALVRLLAPLDVAAPAVRTAVSRMVRQGWLEPARVDGAPGYVLTAPARRRLDLAAERIYRTHTEPWDGTWHLLVIATPLRAADREHLGKAMRFLGYAALGERAWIAVRRSPEVDAVLGTEAARAESFLARNESDPAGLAARTWDLDALAEAYAGWTDKALRLVSGAGEDAEAATQFAARSRLVHEWRKFLFSDPGLPAELLPDRWPGHAAADLFDREATRLAPAAKRFVDDCLDHHSSTSQGARA